MSIDTDSGYELSPGSDFAGYVIIEPLGHGGVGEVYLAQHPRLPRRVALKVLRGEYRDDEEFRRRFAREADLASTLEHPGIVSVFDRGEQSGRLWLAMRYVDGTDAARLRRREGQLEPVNVARIVADIAEALDYAHAKGVIHRDVKPGNILLVSGPDGYRALLADFGIAFPVGAATRITSTDSLVGSVEYTAPERLTDGDVDDRADQYSLACTAYELLVGEPPFERATLVESVTAHLSDPMPSVSSQVPGLHWVADQVLGRAMSKRREDRYDNCRAFADDLTTALSMRPDWRAASKARLSPERSRTAPKSKAVRTERKRAESKVAGPDTAEPMAAERKGSQPTPPKIERLPRQDSKPSEAPTQHIPKEAVPQLDPRSTMIDRNLEFVVQRHPEQERDFAQHSRAEAGLRIAISIATLVLLLLVIIAVVM